MLEWKITLEQALAQAPSVALVMGHNGIYPRLVLVLHWLYGRFFMISYFARGVYEQIILVSWLMAIIDNSELNKMW